MESPGIYTHKQLFQIKIKKILYGSLYILFPLCFFAMFYLGAAFACNEWDMFKWGVETKFPFAVATIMFAGWGVIFAYMLDKSK